jgi:hypothetical protein
MVLSVTFHTDFLPFLYLKIQSQNAEKPMYYSTEILFGKQVKRRYRKTAPTRQAHEMMYDRHGTMGDREEPTGNT